MSNGNLELRDRLQEIIAVKQGMAERLGKILFRNYLERATPKTKDAITLLVHDYEDIQTLAGAILDYDIDTGKAIEQRLSDIEGGVLV